MLGLCYKFIILALFPHTRCPCKNIKPRRENPEMPRLRFVTVPFETQSTEELSALFNLHNWCCVHIMMPEREGGKAISNALEKVWENSFPLGRIVRKQVYSAKSGQIFKPLALIKVGSCDSIISYVLFMMALHLNTNASGKLHSQVLEGPGRLYAMVQCGGLTLAGCQALIKASIAPLHNRTGERKYSKRFVS